LSVVLLKKYFDFDFNDYRLLPLTVRYRPNPSDTTVYYNVL